MAGARFSALQFTTVWPPTGSHELQPLLQAGGIHGQEVPQVATVLLF